MNDHIIRKAQAGIPGNGGEFAGQNRTAATATLAPTGGLTAGQARLLSASIVSRIDDAQASFTDADLLADGRESGRAHALAETYARLVFDEGDDFDYGTEGEALLNDRISGDADAFALPLDIDARKRDQVVEFLRARTTEAFVKATSGDEIEDVAAFHYGEYESFEELLSELEPQGGDL